MRPLHHSAAAEERDLTPELFVLSAGLIGLPDYSGEKEQGSRSAARLGWKHTAPQPHTPRVLWEHTSALQKPRGKK